MDEANDKQQGCDEAETEATADSKSTGDDESPEDDLLNARGFIGELFEKMGLNVELQLVSEKRFLRVFITGDDAEGLVIGSGAAARATVLEAIQLILGRALFGGEGGKTVIVDVNRYRDSRCELLERSADRLADKCSEIGKSLTIYGMNSFDRRAVHVRLSNREDIRTDSQGEGTKRVLQLESLKKARPGPDESGEEPLDVDLQ